MTLEDEKSLRADVRSQLAIALTGCDECELDVLEGLSAAHWGKYDHDTIVDVIREEIRGLFRDGA